jgi:hypothetical protein
MGEEPGAPDASAQEGDVTEGDGAAFERAEWVGGEFGEAAEEEVAAGALGEVSFGDPEALLDAGLEEGGALAELFGREAARLL